MVSYDPNPINTFHINLPADVLLLIEQLAENAHDHWSLQRLRDGWTYGPRRDDTKKEHPCLVPYTALPEAEKHYDRLTATETLKAILALGYTLTRPGPVQ